MTSIQTSDIAEHSGASEQEPWYIASVTNHIAFGCILRGFKKRHKMLQGCYNGEVETSFLLDVPTYEWALTEGWFDDQESVLYLGAMERFGETTGRRAQLQFLGTGIVKPIGLFVETIIKPVGGAPYTYDFTSDTYFQCVPLPARTSVR